MFTLTIVEYDNDDEEDFFEKKYKSLRATLGGWWWWHNVWRKKEALPLLFFRSFVQFMPRLTWKLCLGYNLLWYNTTGTKQQRATSNKTTKIYEEKNIKTMMTKTTAVAVLTSWKFYDERRSFFFFKTRRYNREDIKQHRKGTRVCLFSNAWIRTPPEKWYWKKTRGSPFLVPHIIIISIIVFENFVFNIIIFVFVAVFSSKKQPNHSQHHLKYLRLLWMLILFYFFSATTFHHHHQLRTIYKNISVNI